MSKPSKVKIYYQLTKPGIIYGNALTATGGFLLASKGHINFGLYAAALAGISLVIASACVFNNCLDRNIDKKMKRTQGRALVQGLISVQSALVYAVLLGTAGFALLAIYVNWLTVLLGVIAMLDYVIFYGIAKRRSVHGTIVGSVAGALPIVAGYTAVVGRLDTAALLLFLILVLWQMPHFYAIATYRSAEYAAANVPVLPLKLGLGAARIYIFAYVIAFIAASLALTIFGYTGATYLIVTGLVGLVWFRKALQGFGAKDPHRWARSMFLISLIVITVFSLMLSLDAWLA